MAVSSPSSPRARRSRRPSDYAVPALDKGLDILELLAAESGGLTQTQIAQQLGRTHAELFRMLVCLERRAYVIRQDDRYRLTTKLFELSHRPEQTRNLLAIALPVMQALSMSLRQSCHLVGRHGADEVLVLAAAESPEPRSFVVRIGSTFPILSTASGRVLLAFAGDRPRTEARTQAMLDAIRKRGMELHRSDVVRGVIDISAPVRDARGNVVAALTVPILSERSTKRDPSRRAADALLDAVRRISSQLGYAENE